MPPSSFVFGATGLVGSFLVTTLLGKESSPSSPSSTFGKVHTITRRTPKQAETAGAKLDAIVEKDTAQWTKRLEAANPTGATVFSALGTTRAQAGGIANQWKIDHDLNVDVARAAKAAGATTFVFVSSAGTRSLLARSLPYSRMKNGVEDTIRELGFDQTIIVKPGLIMGDREVEHAGAPLFKAIVYGLGRLSPGLQDALGQEAEVIARATAHAAQLAADGKAPDKYWVVEPSDIVRLGRTEWKE